MLLLNYIMKGQHIILTSLPVYIAALLVRLVLQAILVLQVTQVYLVTLVYLVILVYLGSQAFQDGLVIAVFPATPVTLGSQVGLATLVSQAIAVFQATAA